VRPFAPEIIETAYISVLCVLYDDQGVAGLNAYPYLRGKGLKALIKWLKID